MREADGRGHYLRKNRWPGLREKEFGIARIKRGVEDFLDGRQIDGLVFYSEVISMDQHSRRCKKQKSANCPDRPRRIDFGISEKREMRNKKPGNHSAMLNVSTCCAQSDSDRLCRMRTQRFQRRMASSLPAGLILAASSKQRMASSNSTSK